MRYFTTLKGRTEQTPVDIEALGNGRFALVIGGEKHEVDAFTLDHGAVSLILNGRSYNVEFDAEGYEVSVQVKTQLTRVDVASERQLRLRVGASSNLAEGKQLIVAPMPGKVIRVLVKVGDSVTEGQGLVVVEAMKMENELKSPKAGKVTELYATEGVTVEINAKLLAVE